MSAQRHEAEQFAFRLHDDAAAVMQRYTLGALREMRETVPEELSKASVNAKALAKIAGNERGSGAAYAKAAEHWKPGSAVRAKLRTFRTLCLYIATREQMEAPHAKPAAALPPPNQLRKLCPAA